MRRCGAAHSLTLISGALGFALAVLLGFPRPVVAGDLSRQWMTIETEHFVVHYYQPLDDVAERVAVVAEHGHLILSPALGHSPRLKTNIVLVDDTDGANGFASVLPRNTIRLFATAPSGLSALNDHDDWLYSLTAHEYTHILHLDSIGGIAAYYNKVFGKIWAPNQVQPRWIIEGIATYEESLRSAGGRLRHSLFHTNLRMATLSGAQLELDALTNGPRGWPHGTAAYQYGSHFLNYVFNRYGDDKLREMSWNYGTRPIPYGINYALSRSVGRSFVDLYEDWRAYLREKYSLQRDMVDRKGRQEGRRLTFSGESNVNPSYTADGKTIVWSQSDGFSRARLRGIPRGKDVRDAHDYALIDRTGGFDLLSDGSMVVEQNRTFRTNYSFQDLFLWDRTTRELTRLTHGARARDPAISPDERKVAFVVNGESRARLAVMPLRPEAEIRYLWEGDGRFDQAYSPEWSPDGSTIAFSAWRAGGYRDVLLVDVETGNVRELMHDRALDIDPVFSPDGRYVFYSSDRSGIYNIYAHELATGSLRQVTNVLGCAILPDVSPDGRSLVYTGFALDGYDLFEIELSEDAWMTPDAYIDTRPDSQRISDEIQVSSPRPYRPLETLAPQTYTYQLGKSGGSQTIGLSTSGSDIVGHHAYSLGGTVRLNDGKLRLGVGYSYRRLWPSLSISASRNAQDAGGLFIDGQNTSFNQDSYVLRTSLGLPVMRNADAAASLAFTYDVEWRQNVDGQLVEPDPNTLTPRLPETDVRFAAVGVRLSYSDVRSYTYTVGRQEGQTLSAGISLNHPNLGSDFHTMVLSYGWGTYKKLPWGQTPVLSLYLAGSLCPTDRGQQTVYRLGGVPEQDIVQSVIDNRRAGSSGYLRGYPARVASGTQRHLLNVEYRQLLWEVERGIETLPIYVRRVHLAGLFDAGDAFSDEFDPSRLRTAVGASLRLDLVFGYFIPGSIDFGYARGLNRDGINEFWTLFTGSL